MSWMGRQSRELNRGGTLRAVPMASGKPVDTFENMKRIYRARTEIFENRSNPARQVCNLNLQWSLEESKGRIGNNAAAA